MLVKLRKITSKSEALVASSTLLHSDKKLTFVKDEGTLVDSLTAQDGQIISGFSAIYAYLNGLKINSPLFSDYFFVLNQLKNGEKIISQEALSKLDVILSVRKNLSGETAGDLDIIAYSRIRKFVHDLPFSIKHFSNLSAWFSNIQSWAETAVADAHKLIQLPVQKEKKGPPANLKKPEGEQKLETKPEKVPKVEKPKKVEKAPEEKKVYAAKPDTIDPEYKAKFNAQKIVRSNEGKPILPVDGERNILITSALPYVNNAPHLGTLIGCVLSGDVFARYARLRGYNTLYVCGTDEYGTATEMKALKEKMTPKEICDKYYAIQRDVYKWFQIDFDIFGRTTTEKHNKITQDIFLQLKDNGFISEGEMSQSFCESCKKFLADRYVNGTCPFCGFDDCHGDQCDKCSKLVNPAELINPKCSVCKNPSIIKETKHFFLDLPQLENEINEFIEKQSKEGDWSENAYKTSKAWIKTGLKKRCITRDLKWGSPIPVAGWEDKVFYVWFDAPIGYPSITANLVDDWEKWWKNPENVKLYQFIGKDNIPFHCVIFPGTLLGTRDNWTFLHSMSSTEYLMYEGDKFSKSKGVGVFGDQTEKTGIPLEVWRYYLLINRPEQNDADFKWSDFAAKNNNELLPNIGNLIQRTLKFVYSKFDKKLPSLDFSHLNEEDKEWLNNIWKLFKDYLNHMENVELKSALKVAMQISSEGNSYMQKNEPWNKANQETGRYIVSVVILVNIIRFLSVIFEPFMPSLSAKINFLLGLETRTEKDEQLLKNILQVDDPIISILNLLPGGHPINEPIPIFRKIEDEEIEKFRVEFGGTHE